MSERIVGHIDQVGVLRCAECYCDLSAEKDGSSSPVYDRSEPHASENCDRCGRPVREVSTGAAEPEPAFPHEACRTPSECRREEVCLDAWNCSCGRQ